MKICFSESLEALSGGLQQALWTLGGVPYTHQTDCLSAAVHKLEYPEDLRGAGPRAYAELALLPASS